MIDPAEKQLFDATTSEFKELKDLLETTYRLGTLDKVYEIFGGYVNRSFGVEMTDPNGAPIDYFVRRYRTTTTDADIKVEHGLIEYVVEHGFPLVANVIKTPEGETFVHMKKEEKGGSASYPWAVYRYLYGEDPYDWINNKMTLDEYYSFASVLAEFHSCSYGFNGGVKAEPQIHEFLDVKKDFFKQCGAGQSIPARNRYWMLYQESLDYLLAMCDKAREGMEESGVLDNVPKTFCHCDYHNSNVKWKDGKCVGVFDLDWAKEDYRLADIGYSLCISIATWQALEDGAMDMECVKAYLQGYNDYTKERGVLPTFTEAEKKAFPFFVLGGAIYLYHWSTDFFNDFENYNEYEWYYYLSHLVKLLHFVDEHEQDFYDLICSVQ